MSSSKKEVVIVDDDRGMREALERLLAAAGYSTAAFSSAEGLLETGPVESAVCFVLDIHLPDLSGLDLYRRLNAAGLAAPVIFITAHDDEPSRAAAAGLGAAAYLAKPFPGRSLLDAVTDAIEAGAALKG